MGIILGIFCIIGASVRSGFQSDTVFLFSLWYNRLVLGIMIGFTSRLNNLPKSLGRGAILGLVVSFAFYSSIGFIKHNIFLIKIWKFLFNEIKKECSCFSS